jgi:hypothetical protein
MMKLGATLQSATFCLNFLDLSLGKPVAAFVVQPTLAARKFVEA